MRAAEAARAPKIGKEIGVFSFGPNVVYFEDLPLDGNAV
jgi:hypothetical protein